MAMFHDFGEARSGDTGVSSLSVHGVCKLFPLEREGLEANLKNLKISQRVLELFDDCRGYKTPEALIVHIADNLEGVEKGFHSARGSKEIIEDVLKNIKSNLEIYRNKKEVDEVLGTVAQILVKEILVPGIEMIADAYGIAVKSRMIA